MLNKAHYYAKRVSKLTAKLEKSKKKGMDSEDELRRKTDRLNFYKSMTVKYPGKI